ncbi:hypothetical protein CLPU_6c00170 [Gottschalkia purinilytica]|uniref:Uncharacterized protein n=1 Tax=Gottschalkia purinilytica TaxID=1503 RepID=A0A0L0WAL4_GOTPU|nr:hypothetical protein [Gottschalkia purinilytica]KNF08531.1 hypothetical protein CLPU_6c00170 [Gottschalkia purinilytica]
MEGWIKLHRQLKDHFVYKDSEMLHIWIHILLSVTHDYCEPVINKKIVKLYPGQCIFGREKWARTLFRDEKKALSVYRTILLFKEADMIDYFPTSKYSIITVKNWSNYQRFFEKNQKNEHHSEQNQEQQNEHKENTENTDIGDSKKHENEHSDEQQKNTNKNVKNEKNINYIYEYWNSKKIITHRKLTKKMETKIKGILKDYSIEEVKETINNYSEIVLDDKYWFTHKWTIEEFIQRGFEKFQNRDVAIQNYLKKEYGNKNESEKTKEDLNWRGTDRRF